VRPLIHQPTEAELAAQKPSKPTEPKKPQSEAVKTIKLVIAFLGLLVGGVLIAWNMGMFGRVQPPPAPARAPLEGDAKRTDLLGPDAKQATP